MSTLPAVAVARFRPLVHRPDRAVVAGLNHAAEADAVFDASSWLRAARRQRRLSQRELARRAGVPLSTLARAESGQCAPRLSSFTTLLGAAGYGLVLIDLQGRPLVVDEAHDRIRDAGDRRLPAHLYWEGRPDYVRTYYWWAWHRTAWPDSEVPNHIWFHRPKEPPVVTPRHGRYQVGYVWDDAT